MATINNTGDNGDNSGNNSGDNIEFDYNKHTWEIFDNYFSNPYVLASHQLSSFNDFIKNVIPTIIENNNPIKIHLPKNDIYTIYIKNCRYKNPEYTDNNNIIEQKMKDEVEELKKELAWDLEYSRLKIKKLKDYVKNELLIDHFVVKAFKNPQLKI